MNIDGRNSALIGSPFATLGTSFSGLNLNSASAWGGHSFWLFEDKNISEVSFRVNSVTGSLASGDIEMHIQEINESTGYPNGVDIATSTTRTALTANQYCVFTFNPAIELTKNKQYCWFVKNLNASPTTNYIALSYLSTTDIYGGSVTLHTERRLNTTNGGSTWSRNAYSPVWRITFDDDTDIGIPIKTTFGSSFGQKGANYTTPKGLRMNLREVLIGATRTGTYASTCHLTIRKQSDYNTIIATSLNTYDQGDLVTNGSNLVAFYFADVILEPNTKYVFVLEYVTGTSGIGLLYAELENNIGDRIITLRHQIGGGINNGDSDFGSSPSYYNLAIHLALIGEYEQPFYQQSSIRPS